MSDVEGQEAPKPSAPAPHDELPKWARQQISEANHEAASFRVQLREAQAARQSLEEEIAAARSQQASFSNVKSDLDKLTAVIKSDVPADKLLEVAKLVQGTTPEEMEAHAATLKDLMGIASHRPVDRFQGQQGSPAATPQTEFASFIQGMLNQ